MKTDSFFLRLDPEFKIQLRKTASNLGQSVTELFMESLTSSLAKKLLAHAQLMVELIEQLPADDSRWKTLRDNFDSYIAEAKYFHEQYEALDAKAPIYREIESLEAYRDFLRETVA